MQIKAHYDKHCTRIIYKDIRYVRIDCGGVIWQPHREDWLKSKKIRENELEETYQRHLKINQRELKLKRIFYLDNFD